MATQQYSSILYIGIKKWMTLKRGWILYLIALAAFIISNIFIHSSLFTSLGINVMTILSLFLIMITSNQELRKSTEKEAKAFVDSLKEVTSELKKVSEATVRSTEAISRVESGITSVASKTTELVDIEQTKGNERINLLKPRIFVSVFIDNWGWFAIFKHYYISVSNIGGDAKNVTLYFPRSGQNMQSLVNTLTRGVPWNIDYGDIAIFKITNPLNIQITLYDMDGRNYYGDGMVNIGKGQLTEIDLRLQQIL